MPNCSVIGDDSDDYWDDVDDENNNVDEKENCKRTVVMLVLPRYSIL